MRCLFFLLPSSFYLFLFSFFRFLVFWFLFVFFVFSFVLPLFLFTLRAGFDFGLIDFAFLSVLYLYDLAWDGKKNM